MTCSRPPGQTSVESMQHELQVQYVLANPSHRKLNGTYFYVLFEFDCYHSISWDAAPSPHMHTYLCTHESSSREVHTHAHLQSYFTPFTPFPWTVYTAMYLPSFI